jgi:hypothetical protein
MSKELEAVIAVSIYLLGILANFKVLNIGRNPKFPQPEYDKHGYWDEVADNENFEFMLATTSSWIGMFLKMFSILINHIKRDK